VKKVFLFACSCADFSELESNACRVLSFLILTSRFMCAAPQHRSCRDCSEEKIIGLRAMVSRTLVGTSAGDAMIVGSGSRLFL